MDSGQTGSKDIAIYAQSLQEIVQNQRSPAAARVTAARTLAELDGQLGRHQAAPERQGAMVSSLSREDLVSELDRLRTLIGTLPTR